MTTVAEFEIEYYQFLDAEGKLREPAPALSHDSAELIKMYRLMTLIPIASQIVAGIPGTQGHGNVIAVRHVPTATQTRTGTERVPKWQT